MSRYNRPRQIDNSRNLIQIKDAEEFKGILQEESEVQEKVSISHVTDVKTKKVKRDVPESKEPTIIIPHMSLVHLHDRPLLPTQQYVEYLKIDKGQNLPRNDIYEVDDEDLKFIEAFNKKSTHRLTHPQFEKLVETCEQHSKKDEPAMFYDVKCHLQEPLGSLSLQKIEEIYEFWKNKRSLLKRSLVRVLWKPQGDETNPNVAFRAREKDKMKLRRTNRINESENFQRLKHFKQEMEVTKLLTEQILIRDQMKLSKFEYAQHSFEQQRQDPENKPCFLTPVEQINSAFLVHQQEIKKLQVKQTKYITNTKQENYLFMQNNSQKGKKASEQYFSQDKHNSNESFNFNIASLLSSLVVDSYNNNITKEMVENPRLLQKIRKSKNEGSLALNPNPSNGLLPPGDPMGSSRYYPSTSLQKQKNLMVKDMQKMKETKKNILKFNIRRRIDRQNQVFIDRYLPGDINDISFNPRLYVRSQYLFTSTAPSAPSPSLETDTLTMEAVPKSPSNNNHFNILIREKMLDFQKQWNISEDESEDNNESVRNIKKSLSGFRSFMRQKKQQQALVQQLQCQVVGQL